MPKNGGSGGGGGRGPGTALAVRGGEIPRGGSAGNNPHQGFNFREMANEFLDDLRLFRRNGELNKISQGFVSSNTDFFAGLSEKDARSYYRQAARLLHPDNGGLARLSDELSTSFERVRETQRKKKR